MRLPLALALAAAVLAGHAQWTNNTALNTAVRAGAGVDAATPLMSDGPDGSTYVSWFDGQPGGYQLRMQRLDADGYPLWAPEGLLVSDHPQNSALFRYDLRTDGLGNAVVAFQDERTGQLDIVVYKISPNGTFLWGADGITLTDTGAQQGLAPAIGILPNDHVLVAWNANDGAAAKWVPYQLFDADGVPQWATPHQVIGPVKYSRPRVVSTGDGFLLQYVEETGNFPFVSNLYVQRFALDGTALWPQPTHLSTKTISAFYFPEPVPDGHDGLYLAFNTSNPANAALTDVYVQRLRGSGSLWSATGTPALTGTITQRYGGRLALLNEPMGLMVPVQVTNTAQSQGGWSVQRLDTAGTVQLGPNGVEVVAPSAQLATPDGIASTGDGGVVVYSEGGFGQEHIRVTRIGVAGDQVWGAPIDLCTVNSNKDDVACGRVSNGGQLVAVWQDDRVGSGVYAQALLDNGTLPLPSAVPMASGNDLSVDALHDAAGSWLRVRGAPQGTLQLRVFDAAGRTEATVREHTGASEARVLLPALASGVHVVEVTAGAQVQRVRVVVP